MRLIDKMQKMVMSAEDQITRLKLALNLGDIEKMYDTLKINIPRKIKLALWLVMQFESSDFNFDVIYQEDRLQEHYEQLEQQETEKVAR